jgi:putative ABC transport system permease protein
MAGFDGIRRALRVSFGAKSVNRAVADEIEFHIDARIRDLTARGVSASEAQAMALREFGDVRAAQAELAQIDRRILGRDARAEWWADVRRDVFVAIRSLGRQPVLTAAILITLALGIGANAAIFTVVQSALLTPLPYDRPDRLVHLWQTRTADDDRTEASYPDFVDWRATAPTFAQLEGYDATNVTIGVGDVPTRIQGGRVTSGFFAMLGVNASLGRLFVAGEDLPGAARIVVISNAFWHKQYGADPRVIGRTLTIDNAPYEIVGVLPERFQFAPIGVTDIWVPLDRSAETRAERFNHWLNVVGRLRDGVTVDDAVRDLALVMRRLASEYPETNAGRSAIAVPLRDEIVGDVRPLLLVLSGAVTLVLVIACANVAGLLLARSISRSRELAIRTALGASRWRLVRQLLTESLVLSVAGGALGVWIAIAGARVLVAAIPEGMRSGMPYWEDVHLDTTTLFYTMAVAVGTGVLFGLVPAITASRASMTDLLRRGGRGIAGGRTRLRDVIVAGEIALTIVLLVGTGLLVRSLRELLRVNPGFDAGQVMTARIAVAGPRYSDDATLRRFFSDVIARVSAGPGVAAVGAVSNLPLNGGGTNTFRVSGLPEPSPSSRPEATMRAVAGDYFSAMRIRMVEGRAFTSRDDSAAAPVIIINQSLAKQLLGPKRALGARFRFYAFPEQEWEVVGVVADVKTSRLDAAAPPTVYYSQLQAPQNRMSLAVRLGCPFGTNVGSCSESAIAAIVRRAVAESDPNVPVYAVATMEQQLVDSPAVFARRYPLLLVGLFAATALVLAVVGLYGVISYSVAQRAREFGIRAALGASPGAIRQSVLRRASVVAGAGVLVGAPAALAASGVMRGMLYGVKAADPLTYVGACALLTGVALIASWIPARRATRIDPTVALRAD